MQSFVQYAEHLPRRWFDGLYLVDADDHRLLLPPAGILAQAEHFRDRQVGGGRIVPVQLANAGQRQRFRPTLLADDAQGPASSERHGGGDEEHQALGVLGNVGGGHGEVQHALAAGALGLLAFDELAQQLGLAGARHAVDQHDAAAGIGVAEDVLGVARELPQLVGAPGEVRGRVALRSQQPCRLHGSTNAVARMQPSKRHCSPGLARRGRSPAANTPCQSGLAKRYHARTPAKGARS